MYAGQMDFAYFAATLGWGYDQYGSCTPVQLLFIRKEIESGTVRESTLMQDAVQVAVNNCLSRRKAKLWVRRNGEYDDSVIPLSEIEAIQAAMDEKPPWTPWQTDGGE